MGSVWVCWVSQWTGILIISYFVHSSYLATIKARPIDSFYWPLSGGASLLVIAFVKSLSYFPSNINVDWLASSVRVTSTAHTKGVYLILGYIIIAGFGWWYAGLYLTHYKEAVTFKLIWLPLLKWYLGKYNNQFIVESLWTWFISVELWNLIPLWFYNFWKTTDFKSAFPL